MAGDTRNIKINVTVDSDTRGSAQAAESLQRIDTSAEHAGKSLGGMAEESKKLDAELVRTRARIKELGNEFNRTGDRSIFGDLRKERSYLAELKRISKEVADVATPGNGNGGLGLKFDSSALPGLRGPLIGGLVGIGALLSPAIGAMISGAVVGTVAGGGIIGGIVAAAHDQRVAAVWQSSMSDVFSAKAFGSEAFAEPVIQGIGTIKQAILSAHIGDTLALGAPAVDELARGVGQFIDNVMPGFNEIMSHSEAIMGVFADGIAGTGSAISDLLKDVVESKGTLEGLHFLFQLINGTIIGTGNTLHWLGDRFDEMVHFAAGGTGALEDIASWITKIGSLGMLNSGPINELFSWMNNNMEDIAGTAPMAANGMAAVGAVINHMNPTLAELAAQADAVANNLNRVNTAFFDLLDVALAADAASDQFAGDLIKLKEAVAENGHALDDQTEAGLRNRDMLRQLVQDAEAHYKANINAGMSAQDAKKIYEDEIRTLEALAIKLGFASDGVAALIGQWRNMPTVVTTEYRIAYTASTGGYAGGEHSGLGDVRDRGFQAFDTGGMVQGAPGSAQLAVVHGGERVLTAAQQAAMWAGGGGGGVAQVELLVRSGGSAMDDLLVQILSKAVQVRGGDGAVLGIRTVTG